MSSPDRQDMEKAINAMDHIEKSRTAGGHVNDTSQPSLPTVHRRFANPAPLGLYSFATGIFLLSTFGLDTRGITVPNILVGVLIFFTGIAQFLAGIMEFVAGNTVRSCFCSQFFRIRRLMKRLIVRRHRLHQLLHLRPVLRPHLHPRLRYHGRVRRRHGHVQQVGRNCESSPRNSRGNRFELTRAPKVPLRLADPDHALHRRRHPLFRRPARRPRLLLARARPARLRLPAREDARHPRGLQRWLPRRLLRL